MCDSKAQVENQWVKISLIPEILKNKYFREDNTLHYNTQDKVNIRDVQIKFIGAEEAFMLTTCYRATITMEEANGERKTTTLMVKKTPKLPQETYDSIQFGSLFNNEILSYNTILPAIEEFAQRTFNIPRFYFGELYKSAANVVLQDFATGNWRVTKQKVNLSLAHALVAVSNLGTFHGTGFALRYKNRKAFDHLTKDLKEPRYSVMNIQSQWKFKINGGAERIVIATKKYQPHIDEEFLTNYQRLISEYVLFGRKMVAPVEPLVTLCHGDFLRNNIAFKYAAVNDTEEPIDALMFDLQTTRVSSPMLDFCTFLCLSTFTDVRHKHFIRIFNEYYHKLITEFKANTQEDQIPVFLSRESMLREYVRLLPYGVSIASHFLMQLVEPNSISSEELLLQKPTPKQIRQDCMKRGGEEVDRELSSQMRELYELVQAHQLDIFEGFDYV